MDQLPDDLLLGVMSLLSVTDVFACRLVCKRLAGLAGHPDVWHHRHLDLSHSNGRTMCPVLRLAPCARKITTTTSIKAQLNCLHGDRLTLTASCATRALDLTVTFDDEGRDLAALIIRQQKDLGRLRSVTLTCLPIFIGSQYANNTNLLLGLLAYSTPGLEELEVKAEALCAPAFTAAGSATVTTPSLKRFSFWMNLVTEPFCSYMLATHATTLEAVELITVSGESFASTCWGVLAMPNLRKLSCSIFPGLEAVAAWPSLRELTLTVSSGTWASVLGAAELLRRATYLRAVHLHTYGHFGSYGLTADNKKAEVCAQLLLALAASGQSQVETLFVEDAHPGAPPTDPSPQLQALLQALPSLPALHTLQVNRAPDALLLALAAAGTAPSLRSLQLLPLPHRPDRSNAWLCSHGLLHGDTLRPLLSARPSLHVELHAGRCSRCDPCRRGCHEEQLTGKGRYVGIFAHPADRCPSPEDHVTDGEGLWFHINDLY